MPAAISGDINPPTSPTAHHRRASLKVLSRNIDKVALGNLVFSTSYYSPYPDSIIHDHETSANTITVKLEAGAQAHTTSTHDAENDTTHTYAAGSANGITKHPNTHHNHGHSSHNTIPNANAVLDILYVCPYCFRYTTSVSDFAGHIALHVKAEADYYNHSGSATARRNTRRRRSSSAASADESEDDAPRPVPDSAIKVYSHGGYTVWDIDGEVEKLYCQNLSLFGKLFIDSKSVFWDTAGFHYFVLTYCPPSLSDVAGDAPSSPESIRSTKQGRRQNAGKVQTTPTGTHRRRRSSALNSDMLTDHQPQHQSIPTLDRPSLPLRHQVLGFFSKENLSWDANNLACILVFPPYQHRNLGQLLMAVSYKLSGWEWEDSIVGGPEKPLSVMGRKSYLRFWSERIARFIMGQSQDAEGLNVFEEGVMEESEDGTTQIMTGKKRKRKHGKGLLKDEFTVKKLGDRTGMLGEDVVAALVEMSVCDVKTPKRKKTQVSTTNATPGSSPGDRDVLNMIVNRSKVLEWAETHGVDLVSPVKEEGFLGEWALSEEGSEEDDMDQQESVQDEVVEDEEASERD